MPNPTEEEVIRKVREHARRRELSELDVMYRVSGGSPGEQLANKELHVSATNPAKARVQSIGAAARESSENLAAPEREELMVQIAEALDELTPRSQARFLPDSIVGQISLKIGGQESSFFFLADEEQAKQQQKVLSAKAARAVRSLMRLHTRILKLQE